jgi:hypothetical protein
MKKRQLEIHMKGMPPEETYSGPQHVNIPVMFFEDSTDGGDVYLIVKMDEMRFLLGSEVKSHSIMTKLVKELIRLKHLFINRSAFLYMTIDDQIYRCMLAMPMENYNPNLHSRADVLVTNLLFAINFTGQKSPYIKYVNAILIGSPDWQHINVACSYPVLCEKNMADSIEYFCNDFLNYNCNYA